MMTPTINHLCQPRRVRTVAERTAAYRLRYEAFIAEQRKTQFAELVDHEHAELPAEADTDPLSELFICGPSARPSGTVNLRVWAPGRMPADVARYYSLDALPAIGERTVAELSRLTIRREARAGVATNALVSHVLERAMVAREADLIVMCCLEWLVPIYLRFGLRPFGAAPIQTSDGLMPVLMFVVTNFAPARASHSPFLPMVERWALSGAFRSRADLSPYAARLEEWTGGKVPRPYARSA